MGITKRKSELHARLRLAVTIASVGTSRKAAQAGPWDEKHRAAHCSKIRNVREAIGSLATEHRATSHGLSPGIEDRIPQCMR
jgi:hypothetical protein